MDHSLLQQLKDIHDPAPISWWPLAVGWYGVLLIMFLLLGAFIFLLYRHRQRQQRDRIIFDALEKIETKISCRDPTSVSDCSVLLRKIALAKFPRQQVAGLHGQAWLEFLDQTGNTQEFSQGCGQVLITAAYQQQWDERTIQLMPLIKQWIKQCLK